MYMLRYSVSLSFPIVFSREETAVTANFGHSGLPLGNNRESLKLIILSEVSLFPKYTIILQCVRRKVLGKIVTSL